MPKQTSLNKVLIIGSGPIVIRQGAEFDYAGIQACRAMREEGIETVLVNSNPATIMTDPRTADKVYLEPLTEEALEKILDKERPDGILAGFGGQAGLNLAAKLEENGILEKYGVQLLGAGEESLRKARDRKAFKELMGEIEEPVPGSIITSSIVDCYEFTEDQGFPVVIRPAYMSGGTSIGIAETKEELERFFYKGVDVSSTGQILLEKSVAGWKEIIFEGIRDSEDKCLIISCIEDVDPVGIHMKDSIAVTPPQTLKDEEYQMLREAAIKIIRSMQIEGGCNVQFALNSASGQYFVLEVNPGVSRSSALTTRATGYPMAGVAARIALGYTLDDLAVEGGQAGANCEPVMDRVAVKFPRWPFGKFKDTSRELGTQMKATGETVALDSCFESALLKAISSADIKSDGLSVPPVAGLNNDKLIRKLYECDDERIFCVAEIMRRDLMTVEKLFEITKIDVWFLQKIHDIIDMENKLKTQPLTRDLVHEAVLLGLTIQNMMDLSGAPRTAIQDICFYNSFYPGYKEIHIGAGGTDTAAPYYYASYDVEGVSAPASDKKILIIGPGPIRIGQSGEFDCSCAQGMQALRELGYDPVIINNNPEAVNTDFGASEKQYFEPLYIDDVMNVFKQERPAGVIIQFGGHTSMNLVPALRSRCVPILGTSYEDLAVAMDREQLAELLKSMGISAPERIAAYNEDDAFFAVEKLGYPLVVRPSDVSGGALQVVYSDHELIRYLRDEAGSIEEHPVLIDQYIRGKELEVDAICDGENVLIPGILEHVERAGVHSGDSISIYPAPTIPEEIKQRLASYTEQIAKALHIVGSINIQYAWDEGEIYVIDVNPRASRSTPILSKATGIPIVKLSAAAMLGTPLTDWEYGTGLYPAGELCVAKIPVFSGAALEDMDMALGHEMKSTGEVLGIDTDTDRALYKGFLAEGSNIPVKGNVFLTLRTTEQNDYTADILAGYVLAGFRIYATDDTIKFVQEHGIAVKPIDYTSARNWIMYHEEDDPEQIAVVISVPEIAGKNESLSFPVRLAAAERKIPAFSCLDTAKAFLQAIRLKQKDTELEYRPLA